MISLEYRDLLATPYSDRLLENIIPAQQRYSASAQDSISCSIFFSSSQYSDSDRPNSLHCIRLWNCWLPAFLTRIVPGKVKVDLINFDIKFQTNATDLSKKYLFLLQHLPNLFELLTRRQQITFWRIFVSSLAVAPPCWPPGVTAITDHPWVGCSPQSSAVPVRIPISFRSQAVQSAWGSGFSVGRAISFFLSGKLALHCSGKNSRNHKALLHTRQILGKVSLD